jgi:hypothetical protein
LFERSASNDEPVLRCAGVPAFDCPFAREAADAAYWGTAVETRIASSTAGTIDVEL